MLVSINRLTIFNLCGIFSHFEVFKPFFFSIKIFVSLEYGERVGGQC